MADVITTPLLRGRSAVFGPQFLITMSDGSALQSPVQLSVANSNALTGFPPGPGAVLKKDVPAGDSSTGPGFTPDATQVRVTPFTTSEDENTPGADYVTIDRASYVKDTGDPTDTSMKLDIYIGTNTNTFAILVECVD